MTRSIPINYARVLSADFGNVTPSAGGTAVITYVVGTASSANGVTSYQERPSENEHGQATAQVPAGATVTQIWQAILPVLCSQEGLDLTAGDQVFPVPA
jgi:hypothetical protein